MNVNRKWLNEANANKILYFKKTENETPCKIHVGKFIELANNEGEIFDPLVCAKCFDSNKETIEIELFDEAGHKIKTIVGKQFIKNNFIGTLEDSIECAENLSCSNEVCRCRCIYNFQNLKENNCPQVKKD